MKRPSLAVALPACLLGLIFGASGCATVSPTGGVSVSVIHVLPLQTSLFETGVALTLRLMNESPQPLTLVGGAHRLFVNDSYVGRAVTNERVTLPQLGTATQTVTVYLENLMLMRKIAELSNTTAPKITYRLESRLHTAEGQRAGSIATISTGELDLSGLVNTVAPPTDQRSL